jgi:hypothetical protein
MYGPSLLSAGVQLTVFDPNAQAGKPLIDGGAA